MKASFTLGLFATQMVSAAVSGYDDTQAQIALDLDIVAYCGHDAYKTHVFSGVTEGFIHTKTLYDVKWDVEGYIGYLPSDSAIYVVFRGTDSLRNLIMDGDATSSDYEVVPECAGCKVHTGFYQAANAVWGHLYQEVTRLQALHPDFQLKVTGHSMGAALAQLTGTRFSSMGIDTYMINFGQPRVGNQAYAEFANQKFTEQWRVVNFQDPAVHVPLTSKVWHYKHSRTEMYADVNNSTVVRKCDATGEDPTCSDQWKIEQWILAGDDHIHYLGRCLGEGCVPCTASFLQ